jgi:YHS domain-containing protein
MKKARVLAVLLALSLVLVYSGFTQQANEDTVTCPVSGKVMKKSEAKATFEYEGKTYYFCCEGCKEKFAQDPEKYIQKKAETKDVYTCPMHPDVTSDQPGKCAKCGMNLEKKAMPQGQGMMMQHGQMSCCQKMTMGAHGHGGMMTCPLRSADVEMKTENLPDGVAVKFTSKNPETIKKIQEHFAQMKSCCQKAVAAPKQEENK